MKSRRISSVDAFRGLTVAAMIIVNMPGSWKYIYLQLRHAEWNEWTLADLIFPFFLFIVGISITLAFSTRMKQGFNKGPLYKKIIKRAVIIFLIGILLNLIPYFNLTTFRIPGILQRIALCYLFSAILFLNVGVRRRMTTSIFILILYWAIMKWVPVPGFGPGILDYEGDLVGYIDTLLLSGHLYEPGFDLEGILSTIPAIATTLLGTLAGDWLQSCRTVASKTQGLLVTGMLLIIGGILLAPFFPINKHLWTSTYVLFTAGNAFIFFAILYYIINGRGCEKWFFPFLVLGTNAFAIFAGSMAVVSLIGLVEVSENGAPISLIVYFYDHFLSPAIGFNLGSLNFPLFIIIFWVIILIPFYKRGIFIKV